jgi:serine/threonine protein kinase
MQSGHPISANLRLVRVLGEGGMGSVWIADHLTLGTQVAVKLMARSLASDPEFVERFRREASAAAQLKSPHVAQVFDHGLSADGDPFIVMELLEGEDLGKRIDRSGPQPLGFVSDLIVQTAKALGRAHQLGIVHRDIKPENLFLVENDGDVLVKVLDFGIAKTRAEASVSVTRTGGVFGTPLYMSPEQLLSAKSVDFRADLWSLAVVAYFALSARFPFSGDTVGAISVAVNEGEITPASELRPGLAVEVDAWFQRAFRREASERFESAKEMAEALRAALALSSSLAIVRGPILERGSTTMANLPTVDGSVGSARPASDEISAQRTLGGATLAGRIEPNRRALMLGAALLAAGVGASLAWLRPWQPASPASAPEVAAPAQELAPSPVVVAPSVVPSGIAPRPAETAAGSAPASPPSTSATAAPGLAGSGSARAATGRSQAPASSVTAAPASSPAKAKKDDIGF